MAAFAPVKKIPGTLLYIGPQGWSDILEQQHSKLSPFSELDTQPTIGDGIVKIKDMDLHSLRKIKAIVIDDVCDLVEVEEGKAKQLAVSREIFPNGKNPGNPTAWATHTADYIRGAYRSKNLPCPPLILGSSTKMESEKPNSFDELMEYGKADKRSLSEHIHALATGLQIAR